MDLSNEKVGSKKISYQHEGSANISANISASAHSACFA